MARYLGPKLKLSRRVGVPIADIPKHTAKRQLTSPGMHGFRRGRRVKDFGIRLTEKQKLRFHYGMMEKQFRRSVVEASRRKGNTGDLLLQILEQRLDNVIRRAGFVRTVWAARQMVVHGHILLTPGDEITLREGIHKLARENMESMAGHIVPSWMEVNPSELSAKVLSVPTPDQVPFDVNTNLIVEFYR